MQIICVYHIFGITENGKNDKRDKFYTTTEFRYLLFTTKEYYQNCEYLIDSVHIVESEVIPLQHIQMIHRSPKHENAGLHLVQQPSCSRKLVILRQLETHWSDIQVYGIQLYVYGCVILIQHFADKHHTQQRFITLE